jgi:hypothetical protein
MKRGLLVVVSMLLVVGLALDSSAQSRRGGTPATPPPPPEPTEPNPQIVALMNGLNWGMTRDQAVESIRQEIRDRYRAEMRAVVEDAIAEQRLRNRMERDIRVFDESCVKFDGQETPWNVSMIDKEFTHNNQEEMCKFDRGDSTDYIFFIRGKLWKVFRALSSGRIAAAQLGMDEMRATMETTFGPGEEIRYVDPYLLTSEVVGVRWIDSETELKLMWLSLYGVYAVVLTERTTLGNLANLRTNRPAGETRRDNLMESVTQGNPVDQNADVVDRLLGNRPDPSAGPR